MKNQLERRNVKTIRRQDLSSKTGSDSSTLHAMMLHASPLTRDNQTQLASQVPISADLKFDLIKNNDELLADFGDVAADIVRSAAKSQVITNNLNEEVNTWKERYDGSTAE